MYACSIYFRREYVMFAKGLSERLDEHRILARLPPGVTG